MLLNSGTGHKTHKEQYQTTTQASSQANTQSYSLNEDRRDEEINDDDVMGKKGENKVKYRKLKQKLNNMGVNHDDKFVGNKDNSNPNRQRVLKLALDFQVQVKKQHRDYYQMKYEAREIFKILDNKNQQDLQLIRQSKIIPAIFELLQKVSSMHKSEINNVISTLDIGLRIVHTFASLAVYRDYLIMTNRLNSLVSFISWMLGRDDKKTHSNSSFYPMQTMSFKLLNCLLLHKSKDQTVMKMLNTTIQLILCSPILKKLKLVLFQQLSYDDSINQTQFIIQLLRFVYVVLRKSHTKQLEITTFLSHETSLLSNEQSVTLQRLNNLLLRELQCNGITNQIFHLIQFILPFSISYFNFLHEFQQSPFPTVVMNMFFLLLKSINMCFQNCSIAFKKVIKEMDKQTLNIFLTRIYDLMLYAKDQFEGAPIEIREILNEVIMFVGYLAIDDDIFKKKVYEIGILDELYNLPIAYMMDNNLREVSTPTLCCLIHNNKANMNVLLKDNSPQQIVKFLKKEIQSKPTTLTRKNSTTSLISLANFNFEGTFETLRYQLSMRFPMEYWEDLSAELEKHL